MDKQIKKQWIDELRNGGYKQARGTLKKRNGAMCCLGVLEFCVLNLPFTFSKDAMAYFNQDGDKSYLSSQAKDIADISTIDADQLADRNDGNYDFHPHSFDEIADYIEEHL